MSNEKCKYIYITEDSEVQEVEEVSKDDAESGIGIFLKVIRHGNGKVVIINISADDTKILEI
jgi:hypothetical protein